MSKIDFTKVEQALKEGILKINISHLIHLADISSSLGKQAKDKKLTYDQQVRIALKGLEENVKKIKRLDKDVYRDLGFSKEKQDYFFNPETKLTNEDWVFLKAMHAKVEAALSLVKSKEPSDQDIIQSQRKKQVTKRFNINDKWIPLK